MGYILRGMKTIMVLLLITVLFNLFLTPGRTLVSFWKFTITWEGLFFSIKMAVRLIFLIIASTLMTLTTSPNQLTDALESVLGPLKKIHVPVHEISMMMSIALRFIPILMEETDKIMKASAFRRANDLAMAMEARCYHGGDGRTKMKPLIYKRRDASAYVLLCAFLACCITTRVLGI